MFRTPTVLVLGAGASAEVGLPIGSVLLSDVANRLDITWDDDEQLTGDKKIVAAIEDYTQPDKGLEKLNNYLNAGHKIRQSSTQALSIDNLIDALEDGHVEEMGKLAITSSILEAEGSSIFFEKKRFKSRPSLPDIDLSRFENTWYNFFTKILTEGVKKSEIGDIFSNLEIVNFNYDRCIEYYLPISLANYYNFDIKEVQKIVARLPIHRPYGSVGKLDWEVRFAPTVGFGQIVPERFFEAAHEIRTFTEQMDDQVALEGIRKAIVNAQHVVFLGFAFHRQNLDLLGPVTIQGGLLGRRVLATAMNISLSDQGVIKREVSDALGIPVTAIHLENMSCKELFTQHWRTLTS